MQRGHITIEGKNLEYVLAGPAPEQAPTLIFLHEGLGCVELWRDFPEKLQELTGYGCLIYSRVGYGRSEPLDLPLSSNYLHEQAAVLEKVIANFGIKQPILVGHSDGATIAIIYAGSGLQPSPLAVIVEAPHVFVEKIARDGIAATVQLYEQTSLRSRLRRFHGDKTDDTFRAWSSIWQQPEHHDWNIEALLPNITSPTLVIQGTEDQYGTLAQVEAVANGVTGPIETLILKGCKHIPHQERADDTLQAMARFLRNTLQS